MPAIAASVPWRSSVPLPALDLHLTGDREGDGKRPSVGPGTASSAVVRRRARRTASRTWRASGGNGPGRGRVSWTSTCYVEQAGVDPPDRHSGPAGGGPGAVERDPGRVDRRHQPATPGEPDRVRALAAADVEGCPRHEVGDLGDQGGVRPARPMRGVAGVEPVPVAGTVVVVIAVVVVHPIAVVVPLRAHGRPAPPGSRCERCRSRRARSSGRASRSLSRPAASLEAMTCSSAATGASTSGSAMTTASLASSS